MGYRRDMLPIDDVVAWVCSTFERSLFFATFSYIVTYESYLRGIGCLLAALIPLYLIGP
jgi:hypothetical protein